MVPERGNSQPRMRASTTEPNEPQSDNDRARQRKRAIIVGAILIHPLLFLAMFIKGALFGAGPVWGPDGANGPGVAAGFSSIGQVMMWYILTLGLLPVVVSCVGRGVVGGVEGDDGFGVDFVGPGVGGRAGGGVAGGGDEVIGRSELSGIEPDRPEDHPERFE